MIKYLVGILIGYLVIGVVYGISKIVVECKKRYRLLGADGYLDWINCTSHLDESKLEDVLEVDDMSRYEWYCDFLIKIDDMRVSKLLVVVFYVITWPTVIPLVIELLATALDVVYGSRFVEEDA